MSLFDPKELVKAKVKSRSGAVVVHGKTHAVISTANQRVADTMFMPQPDDTISFMSKGDWSTHDLLFFYLNLTGPAQVFFTTWSISEFAIRQLYSYVDSGLITKLSGLFDYRNGIHKPSELQFLKQIASDVQPSKCHAKVVVILNELWGISIVTSGNFTRNPRIEAGTVYTARHVAEFHKAWILDELNNTKALEKDR